MRRALVLALGCFACLTLALSSPAIADDADRLDHSAWTALLQKYVDDQGLVAYGRWKAGDVPALDAYIQTLQRVDPAALADENERMAFWINAYNAHTVRFMISKWPIASIRDHTARFFGFNVWKDHPLRISGKDYTLHQMEHEILRPLGQPLIHLGLNCASMSCPRLRREAYQGATLEQQLTDDLQAMLADPKKFRVDRGSASVQLSKIFSWFAKDFGRSEAEILAWIRDHAQDEGLKKSLSRADLDVDYLDYDWSVNAQNE